jgi:hypothetical protein
MRESTLGREAGHAKEEGEALIDREGIVRWVNIEKCSTRPRAGCTPAT